MSYPSSAYNSRHFTPQKRPESNPSWSERIHRRGETFSYSQVNDSIATSVVRNYTPSALENADDSVEMYWTHQQLQPHTFVRWAGIYMLMAGYAKAVLYFVCPLCICASLIPLTGKSGLNGTIHILSIVALYVALPALVIYSPIIWVNWFDPKIDKNRVLLLARKKYCLNRETGMVTLYGEKNRKIFSHPFIEFDCILASNPNHQGLLSYRLMLVHRYYDYNQGVNIGSQAGMYLPRDEYKRVWNMIQQYMDVSQPLPDIPTLEPYREQDPTTAAYDKQTGRNPRYWRDMSDEEFEKKLTEMAKTQREEKLPPTGPVLNIFAEA